MPIRWVQTREEKEERIMKDNLATFICRNRLMILMFEEFCHITVIFSANILVKITNLIFDSF